MSFQSDLKRVLGLPESESNTQILWKLEERLGMQASPTTASIQATDDPQADFEKLAELWSKTHGVSLAEGYREVSRQAPILYERATARARLN
jgi:hypothetical protein